MPKQGGEMKRKSRSCFLLVAVIFGMLLLAAENLWADADGTVQVAINYDPSTVNSCQWKTEMDGVVTFPMHHNLVPTNFRGDRYMGLAESVALSADGLDITVKIKRGAVFHTGDPVTAQDVIFTYEQVLDPKNAATIASTFDIIDEMELIDDYTMVFHLYESMAQWQETLLWPAIHSKKYFEKAGRERFLKHPVGSGPFRFVKRKIGESITLERVDNWVDISPKNTRIYAQAMGTNPKVNFKTLKLITVTDSLTRLSLLETGAIDFIYDIQPHQVRKLSRNRNVKIKRAQSVPSLFGLTFRIDNFQLLKDRNLKQAIFLAVNRQELIDKIFLGEGYPLYMFANKVEAGYDPAYGNDFEYSIDKAKAFLGKSNYRPGTPLILSYAATIPQVDLIATMVQHYLKKVGITVKLAKFETGTFISYSIKNDKILGPLGIYGWPGGVDPSFRLQLAISSNGPYCQYRTRPDRKEMDALIEAQAHELDVEKREKILAKIHQLLREDLSGVVLFGLNQIYAMSDKVEWIWAKKAQSPFSFSGIRMVE